jgi:hypothetical protein
MSAPTDQPPDHPLTDAALLKIVNAVHALAVAAAPRLRAPRDYTEHYALLLYFTLIECCGSIALLREQSRVAGVAAVVRSALDAFVDIKNLLSDPEYWRSLEAADSYEWKKIMESASVPGNAFLDGLRIDPKFPEYRSMISQNVANAAARGNTKLSPEERFEKANLRAEYKSLYPMLSADAHNNTSLLNSRHARPEGDGFVIELYSGGGAYGNSVLMTLSELIMFASEDIHERLGFGKGIVTEIRATVEPARLAAEAADRAASGASAATRPGNGID